MHIDFKRLLQLKRCNNGIGKHQDSKTHCEAIEAVITLPKTTADVGELLSKAHREERVRARNILTIKLSSVRYLARQGSALWGLFAVCANSPTSIMANYTNLRRMWAEAMAATSDTKIKVKIQICLLFGLLISTLIWGIPTNWARPCKIQSCLVWRTMKWQCSPW